MRKILLLIMTMLFFFSCGYQHSLKNTFWSGVDNEKDTSIAFSDSTCEIYQTFETGYIDTLKAIYHINHDTISFIPVDDYVTIGSSLIVSEEGLKDSETGVIRFKLK